MYDYDFVTVETDQAAFCRDRPHHAVVRERAAQGWRLVQVLVLDLPATPSHVELVFERPAPNRRPD